MDLETAKQRVEEHINRNWAAAEGRTAAHGPLIIVKHIERPYGWVFFYTSEKYWETKDFTHAVVGNGPIIFDRRTGKLHQLGTATPPDEQICEWEAVNWKE